MAKANFSKLEGKGGKATGVPAYLREVSTYDGKPKARGHRGSEPEAYEQLMIQLVGSSEWYSASAPAIDELLISLNQGARPDIGLALVTDIACGDHVNAWLAPRDEARIPASIVEILAKHQETLSRALGDEDARARAAAAMLVGCVDGLGREFRARLLELARSDSASQVRASAVLALARVAEGDRELQCVLEAMARDAQLTPLLRGASAIAWLRADAGADFEAGADALGDWLASSIHDETTTLHWFGAVWSSWTASGQLLTPTARALAVLARARDAEEKVIDVALTAVAKQPTGSTLESVSTLILDLGGFLAKPGKVDKTLSPNEFSASQQSLLPKLARSVIPIAAGYGLPAAGANRRRWLGLEPPGPLERGYPETGGEPLWRVCQDKTVELPKSLVGLERWKALLELRAEPYARAPKHSYEAELRQFVADPAWFDEISRVIDEIARRGDVARLVVPPPVSIGRSFGLMAILPLLRAGVAVRDSWVFYAWSPSCNLNSEVLRLLPLEQREQLLCRVLLTEPDFSTVLEHLEYASLVPTPKLIAAAIAQLRSAKGLGYDMQPLLEHLTVLIPEHPFVSDALRDAGLIEPGSGA